MARSSRLAWAGVVATTISLFTARAGALDRDCDAVCARLAAVDAHGGVAVSGKTGVTNGVHAGYARALSVDTMLAAFGDNRLGLTTSLEEGVTTGASHGYFAWRGGAVLARSAPYTAAPFGFLLALGGVVGLRPGADVRGGANTGAWACDGEGKCGPYFQPAIPKRFASVFGEARFVWQLPTRTRWHPFVGSTGTCVLSQFGESVQTVTIDVGAAWLGW